MFYWESRASARHPVFAGFTGRSAARGSGAYVGLNLGGHVGDDIDQVEGNRLALANSVGVSRDRLLFMNQVHGNAVTVVDGPWMGQAPDTDAVVTTQRDLALAVLVADCVPVLLHDQAAGVIAAVHAGRPGMMADIIGRTVEVMRQLGAEQVSAVVGPSVCARCYEVPAEMAEEAARHAPASLARSWTGTPAIDVAAGVVSQLSANQVDLQWIPGCTREHDDLYSYRRDPVTGRFAGVIVRHDRGLS